MAIAFVQDANKNSGSVSSDTLAYTSNVTAGNLLVCVARCAGGGAPFSSVSDGLNGTWSSAGAHTQTNDSNGVLQIFFFANTAGGACTVTVTLTSAAVLRFWIGEFSGAATSSVQDGSKASAEGNGTNLASGSLTPAANGALLLCGGFSSISNTFTAGTDFTIPANGPVPSGGGAERLCAEYFIQSTAASHDGTYTAANTNNWAAILAVFKAATGGGTTRGMPFETESTAFTGGRTFRGPIY